MAVHSCMQTPGKIRNPTLTQNFQVFSGLNWETWNFIKWNPARPRPKFGGFGFFSQVLRFHKNSCEKTLCPHHYYWHFRIFSPSYSPDMPNFLEKCLWQQYQVNCPKWRLFCFLKYSLRNYLKEKFTREEIIRGYTIFMENEQTKFYRTRLS